MTLTPTEKLALSHLSPSRLMRPGELGSLLWGQPHRQPQHYARPAGKLLRKLERAGLVRWIVNGQSFGWKLTVAGEAAAEHV